MAAGRMLAIGPVDTLSLGIAELQPADGVARHHRLGFSDGSDQRSFVVGQS